MRILQICENGNIQPEYLGDEVDLPEVDNGWTTAHKVTAGDGETVIEAYLGDDSWPVGTLHGFLEWLDASTTTESALEGDEEDGTREALIAEGKKRELAAAAEVENLSPVWLHAEQCVLAGKTVSAEAVETFDEIDASGDCDYFSLDHETAVEWVCLPYSAQNAFRIRCGKNTLEELAYA